MTADELLAWLAAATVVQRELVATIGSAHGDAIRALPDFDHQRVMRAIKKRINSPSLVAERAALLAALDRTYAPPPLAAMTRPELDAPIADWLVYGDALLAVGDPRGELVHLVHAASEARIAAEVRDAFVRDHWEALLGTTMTRHAEAYAFDWQFCAMRGATVRMTAQSKDLVARLMQAEAARDLRAITLVGETPKWKSVDLRPAMQQLLELAPQITSFAFVDARARDAHSFTDAMSSLVTLGPLAPVLARAEHLALDVADAQDLDFGGFVAPALRSFALRCLRFTDGGAIATMADKLAAIDAPRLESFELRCVEHWLTGERGPTRAPYIDELDDGVDGGDTGENDGVNWRELDRLFAALARAPLRRLALTSFDSATTLLEALGTMRLPATLEELDLSDSRLDATHVAWLLARRDDFGKLARLVIDRVSLAPEEAARLGALGPTIVYSHDVRAPSHRYVASWE